MNTGVNNESTTGIQVPAMSVHMHIKNKRTETVSRSKATNRKVSSQEQDALHVQPDNGLTLTISAYSSAYLLTLK